jgi:hypothetical protein
MQHACNYFFPLHLCGLGTTFGCIKEGRGAPLRLVAFGNFQDLDTAIALFDEPI